ncbi:uncharacterized protein [Ranitomeya imitator]|uniref:uncharacterized protein isoform X2 n=1 Tax=Ranitomeya imitator TaxID=111125 RepID=UPI0037E864A9
MGDRRHADLSVTRRLWEQICCELIPRWEDLDVQAQIQERERIVKRWRSIRDRFKKEFNKEMRAPDWIWRTQEHVQIRKGPVIPQVNDGHPKYRWEHSGACSTIEHFWGDPSGGRHRGTL